MTKALCKSKKTRKVAKKQWNATVLAPTHVCRKCGRLADKKKKLCKPVKIQLEIADV